MPDDVHPQIQAIIDRSHELGIPSVQHLDVKTAREQVEKLAAIRRENYPSPKVHEVENTSTGPGYGHVPVRIYRASESEKAPAVVFFHGGGHVICSLDTHDTIARYLARTAGCTVISVDYRMAPEHPFPAAVEDSFDAVRWVADHATSLRVDASRIGVCGDSAGANLATVVALMAQEGGGISLAAQVLVYPVIDYRGGTASFERYANGYGSLEAKTITWFMEQYLPDPSMRDDWRACPANAKLFAHLPATLVITAEYDVLRDEGVAYAEMMKASGVDVQHAEFQGMTHGFFGFLGLVDAATKAHETVGGFLHQVWRERVA
ncbi:MAG: alpha/beta hydrolase [Sedimentitalea sp.]|uniref:alpha/beta hydrolase n=1 Tax=Sedimentitalea sp. TaxID=2048915 RepID=UPI003267FAC2